MRFIKKKKSSQGDIVYRAGEVEGELAAGRVHVDPVIVLQVGQQVPEKSGVYQYYILRR